MSGERSDHELRTIVLEQVIGGGARLGEGRLSESSRVLMLTIYASRDDRLLPCARLVLGGQGDTCPEPIRKAMIDLIESRAWDLPVKVSEELRTLLWDAFRRERRPGVLEAILGTLGHLADPGLGLNIDALAAKLQNLPELAGAYGYAVKIASEVSPAIGELVAESVRQLEDRHGSTAAVVLRDVAAFSLPDIILATASQELQDATLAVRDLEDRCAISPEEGVSRSLCQDAIEVAYALPGIATAFLQVAEEGGNFLSCLPETRGNADELSESYVEPIPVRENPWAKVAEALEATIVDWSEYHHLVIPVPDAQRSLLVPVVRRNELLGVLHMVLASGSQEEHLLSVVGARIARAMAPHVVAFRSHAAAAELLELRTRISEFRHPLLEWLYPAKVFAQELHAKVEQGAQTADPVVMDAECRGLAVCLELLSYQAMKLVRWDELAYGPAGPLEVEQCSVSDVLEVVRLWEGEESPDGGPAVRIMPYGDVVLRVDRGRVMEALFNVVENAVKNGQPHGPVVIRVQDEPAECQIVIEDSGPGIPVQYLDKIFRPYIRVPQAAEQLRVGYGLGLTIAQRNLRLHGPGNTVRAANRPEGGATFIVTLAKPAASEERT